MRKIKILISMIFLAGIVSCYWYKNNFKDVLVHSEVTEIKNNYSVDQIIDNIYGKNGVNIDLQEILNIKDLVDAITNISVEDQAQIAFLVVKILEEQNGTDEIYTHQVNYFKQIAQKCDVQKIDESKQDIAQQICNYLQFERENILNNQKSRYVFLQAQKSFHLPILISLWVHDQSVDDFGLSSNVVIQDMMTDMAIMIVTQMGSSLANQQIAAQAAGLSDILTKQSKTIQANIKSFQTQAQASQQKDLEKQITNFSNAGKNVQAQMQAAIDTSNLELNYLYKNISLNQPQQQYLSNQITFDQIFSQGAMLTPAGHIWNNPFSVGDWEYEKNEDCFYQYQKSSIFSKDSDGTLSSTRAENNSIFTEYRTTKSTYSISGTMTLYQVEYPFFVGIIFNKSRWISGDYEALRKARMVGIYGKSATDIGIYFAEQYTMTDAQLQSTGSSDPIQQPLQQILAGTVDKKLPLIADAFQNLKINPIVLNFEITTTPQAATFAIWNDQNSKQKITVSNLNSQIFLYHGIGCICPGAIAQFKLTSPVDLLFTASAISNYVEDGKIVVPALQQITIDAKVATDKAAADKAIADKAAADKVKADQQAAAQKVIDDQKAAADAKAKADKAAADKVIADQKAAADKAAADKAIADKAAADAKAKADKAAADKAAAASAAAAAQRGAKK